MTGPCRTLRASNVWLIAQMSLPYDIITFDCYGTLIDWDTGITTAFQHAAREDGVELTAEAILEAYHSVEPLVQQRQYRSYREVLADAAARCAKRLGWAMDPGRSAFLAESLVGWTPFVDTNPSLEVLRSSGYQLGILSNIDDDLFAGTSRHFTVEFDTVITAQQVSSYKPAHGHFLAARKQIGERRWLHAARSYFHDVVPSRALGIPVVWVNRVDDSPSGSERPDAAVESLEGLVQWLANKES